MIDQSIGQIEILIFFHSIVAVAFYLKKKKKMQIEVFLYEVITLTATQMLLKPWKLLSSLKYFRYIKYSRNICICVFFCICVFI